MAIRTVVTRGFGSGAAIGLIVTRGYLKIEEGVHPPGTSSRTMKKMILEEDELLIAVIMAFLQIKDDRWH